MLVELGIQLWQCDICKKLEYSKRLPEGWVVLDRNFTRREIEHHCKDCKEETGTHDRKTNK